MALHYYVIDTETTGLSDKIHEIIEISIIRCADRHQLTKVIKAEYPERADKRALIVCNKTMSDLYYGDSKDNVIRECEEFWDEDGLSPEFRCLIAHNASFDKRFCHALWGSVNKQFPITCWLDTIKFTRDWAKTKGINKRSFSLPDALKFANIKALPGKHTAEADARNTYLLWKKGMINNVDYLSSIKRWPHIL